MRYRSIDREKLAPSALAALALWICCGCSHANRPLAPINLPIEARQRNETRAALTAQIRTLASISDVRIDATRSPTTPPLDPNDDGYFVGLAISGGGSRSANFAAACMFELERLSILQRVDYISSVSGGSLAGAYYCLNDTDWNPESAQLKLTHAFASDVMGRMLLPWNSLSLMFSSRDRTDLLAESFRRHLFHRNGTPETFENLRSDRPRLLINATDLQSGRRFVFCNESFDELNSDLKAYPIANAVAASAAAPVVMHHVTLRDYSMAFEQYVHLIDGGVNDNLGIVTLVETYYAHVGTARLAGLPDPYPNGAIFIILDARTQFDAQLSDKADIGLFAGLAAGAGLTSTALLNRVSSATMSEMILRQSPDNATARRIRRQIEELERTGYLALRDRQNKPVRLVHIALSRLNDSSKFPFHSFKDRVNNIATYFNIDPTEAYHLYKAAQLLVREQFQPYLEEIERDLIGAATSNDSK